MYFIPCIQLSYQYCLNLLCQAFPHLCIQPWWWWWWRWWWCDGDSWWSWHSMKKCCRHASRSFVALCFCCVIQRPSCRPLHSATSHCGRICKPKPRRNLLHWSTLIFLSLHDVDPVGWAMQFLKIVPEMTYYVGLTLLTPLLQFIFICDCHYRPISKYIHKRYAY